MNSSFVKHNGADPSSNYSRYSMNDPLYLNPINISNNHRVQFLVFENAINLEIMLYPIHEAMRVLSSEIWYGTSTFLTRSSFLISSSPRLSSLRALLFLSLLSPPLSPPSGQLPFSSMPPFVDRNLLEGNIAFLPTFSPHCPFYYLFLLIPSRCSQYREL
ncbi:unnamed protein product [Lupinus luteus]|uniref:Uncharacterized protein n=1 Tax=Lupinus luteus TaxID=3873 RepID=A0AAV1Y340_LUPLU